jgi:hypothetical protein
MVVWKLRECRRGGRNWGTEKRTLPDLERMEGLRAEEQNLEESESGSLLHGLGI